MMILGRDVASSANFSREKYFICFNFSTLTSSYPHTLHQTIAKVKLLGPGAHVFGAKTQRRLLLVPVRPSGRLWPLRQVR